MFAKFSPGNCKRRDDLKDLGLERRMILRQVLKN
jgi:hypothetical protein